LIGTAELWIRGEQSDEKNYGHVTLLDKQNNIGSRIGPVA